MYTYVHFMWNIVSHGIWLDFLLFMFNVFPHVSTCYSCCVKIMCKHVCVMWNLVSHGIWLWTFAVYVQTFPHASTCWSCCMGIMCKHVHFMWNAKPQGIWLWTFCCSCLNLTTCNHMLFLLCDNNVQICVFRIGFCDTWDFTVEFWEKRWEICSLM